MGEDAARGGEGGSVSQIAVIVGTRPDAIKLAPVVHELDARPEVRPLVISTGQHREMLDQMLSVFGIEPEIDLAVMTNRQRLSDLTAALISGLGERFRCERPEAVVVQGDTTTAMCAALAAFYERIPVAHVEAGLRTGHIGSPFPEEANRRLVAPIADWHFCPTETNRRNLLGEGIPESRTLVTGNTVIDALHWALRRPGVSVLPKRRPRRALLTLHRRENQGSTMRALATAIRRLAGRGDLEFVFPVHMSPAVRDVVLPELFRVEGVHLCEPLEYLSFMHTLASSDLVLTDSGGLQEEAPSLGKPVLVLRDTTERPEALVAGVARLVGTDPDAVVEATSRLLDDEEAYRAMASPANPYGDGRAAKRVVDAIDGRLSGAIAA